jgi:hypothetical protein
MAEQPCHGVELGIVERAEMDPDVEPTGANQSRIKPLGIVSGSYHDQSVRSDQSVKHS